MTFLVSGMTWPDKGLPWDHENACFWQWRKFQAIHCTCSKGIDEKNMDNLFVRLFVVSLLTFRYFSTIVSIFGAGVATFFYGSGSGSEQTVSAAPAPAPTKMCRLRRLRLRLRIPAIKFHENRKGCVSKWSFFIRFVWNAPAVKSIIDAPATTTSWNSRTKVRSHI